MTEQLAIARLGHRGDAVADGPDGPIYVPYALPGETVEAAPWPGHPDRRHLLRVVAPSPQRVDADLPAFRHLWRLRCSTGKRPPTVNGSALWSTAALEQAGLESKSTP